MLLCSFIFILFCHYSSLYGWYCDANTGVGGNLVAIQASRISTFLHQRQKPSILPIDDNHVMRSPCSALCSTRPDAHIAQILFGMAVPAHILYLYVILLIQKSANDVTADFVIIYMCVALFEVISCHRTQAYGSARMYVCVRKQF